MRFSGWRARRRSGLGVGAKFALSVGVLVLTVVGVAAVGWVGVRRMEAQVERLAHHNLQITQRTADLGAAMTAVSDAALRQLLTVDAAEAARLDAELEYHLVPRAIDAVHAVRTTADEPEWEKHLQQMEADFEAYLDLRRSGAYGQRRDSGSVSARGALATRTGSLFDRITATAQELRAEEAHHTAESSAEADRNYLSTVRLLVGGVLLSLLVALVVLARLIRDLLPRIQDYSRFATAIASGQRPGRLRASGGDELAELGTALNDMVTKRELASQQNQAQAEFVATLQVTATEEEAHELVQRHLQRSIPQTDAVVLTSNNSANRLEAATAAPLQPDLRERLAGVEPRTCLALRFARIHREGGERPPLLSCSLCSKVEGCSTCEPLLVGGLVIGSVLVTHPEPLEDEQESLITETVAQAAPVLGNLRNLALAEFRASNDSLTGLPNKRATEDTLKRMVAQADRSMSPLTAIMLDLDHFKQINDRFGHGRGDEVLAAVGAAIGACLRASDFAGRIGGEEFLLLLPETTPVSAEPVAEKIRRTIAGIRVHGVDHDITASLGIAGLLQHASDATGLLREADRAQYSAKAAGRNCTVIASGADGGGVPEAPDPAGTAS